MGVDVGAMFKHAIDLRCAARGHALAIWLRLAQSALAALGRRSE